MIRHSKFYLLGLLLIILFQSACESELPSPPNPVEIAGDWIDENITNPVKEWFEARSNAVNEWGDSVKSWFSDLFGSIGNLFGESNPPEPEPPTPTESVNEALVRVINEYIEHVYEIDDYSTAPMSGLGDKFVEWGRKENIDPRLAVAIARQESGLAANPTACGGRAVELFNAWALLENGQCIDLLNWDTGIESIFKNLNKHYLKVDPPLDTVDKIATTYCKSQCNDWTGNVSQFMHDMGGDPNNLTFPDSLDAGASNTNITSSEIKALEAENSGSVIEPSPTMLNITLTYPETGDYISRGEAEQYFAWNFEGNLAENQSFEIRFYKSGEPGFQAPFGWVKEYGQNINLNALEGGGDYEWSVVIVQGTDGNWERDVYESPRRSIKWEG